jgi:hypothetical protein
VTKYEVPKKIQEKKVL